MIPNTGFKLELDPNKKSLSIVGSTLKCLKEKKKFTMYCPSRAKMLMKPIQSPSVPIKPREDLDHHQVAT